MSDKEFKASHSRQCDMVMARCATCSNWWSVDRAAESPRTHCPCGGELVEVDMVAHVANLPRGT